MIVQTKITAPVGAAIGRPSVVIRIGAEQNASAKTTNTNITGRADAKTTISILNANRPCAEHRTSDARPYGCGIVVKSASAKTNITIVTGRAPAIATI